MSFASLSFLSPASVDCLKGPSGVHSVNSICATNFGSSHTHFFISSLVNAHCVRFFSGRSAKGRLLISSGLNRLANSRRTCGTNRYVPSRHKGVPVLIVPDDGIERIALRVSTRLNRKDIRCHL